MSHQSLAEYLEYFSRYKNDVAITHHRGYRRVRWTYGQLSALATRFAQELAVRGIVPGDRVLLWGDNCGEWVATFWGCLLRGAVVVPIDRAASPEFARAVAQQVNAKLSVCSSALLPAMSGISALILEELSSRDRLQPVQAGAPQQTEFRARLTRNDIAEIIFTSGATAEPKGVVLTHGNLLANLEPIEKEIAPYRRLERIFHPIRFLNLLPLSHVFGQFMGLLIPPVIGGTVFFQDTLSPSEVAETIARERITALVAVPRMLQSLKDKLERDLENEGKQSWFQREFAAAEHEHFLKRCWRFRSVHWRFGWKFWALISGGATLDQQIEAFWSRLGYAVIQGYGLTETASLITLNHPFRLSKGSIGKQLQGREVRLDESGEILVRGENVASGYWRDRQMTPVAREAGWFRTGDLGAFDEQGNLYFKGRKKNVLVSPAGMNIYPEDLEAALRRQPEVRDCVVVGLSRQGNEEPCAVLLLRTPGDPAQIVQRANQSLAEFQRMHCWYIWPGEDFPRTSTQKPRTNVIRDQVEQELSQTAAMAQQSRREAVPSGAAPLTDLIERITGRPAGALSSNANLESDLNLSSLDRVELLSALEDRFQTDLSEAQISSARTIGELQSVLSQPRSAGADYPYPNWAQRWPVAAVRTAVYYLLVWPATVLMAWPRIRGRERLDALKGPALFVCNHVTEIDIGFVLFALPARFRHHIATAMVGERLRDLRHPPANLSWPRRKLEQFKYVLVSALFNVFSMPKQSGVRASFRFAGESADRGYSILVFPEGELTTDGDVGQFRAGIGVLATRLDLPVVPIRTEGLYELRQAGKRFARPGAVRVTIGEPLHFARDMDPEKIARELQNAVRRLSEHS